jgi:hypothetical protein
MRGFRRASANRVQPAGPIQSGLEPVLVSISAGCQLGCANWSAVARAKRDAISSDISLWLRINIPSTFSKIIWSTAEGTWPATNIVWWPCCIGTSCVSSNAEIETLVGGTSRGQVTGCGAMEELGEEHR